MSRADRIASRAAYRDLNWRGEEKFSALLQRLYNEKRQEKVLTKRLKQEQK